jgi:hypothetical protein
MGASVALWVLASGAVLVARSHPSLAPAARWTALGGAFWVAILAYLNRGGEAKSGSRFVTGLALAGASAHLGWAFLYLEEVIAHPRALLDPAAGHCVLFAPLGILATAPGNREARDRYLAAALGSLPPAFAVARLGCLAGGCCHGNLAFFGVDAIPLCEIAALLTLTVCTRHLPVRWVGPVTLAAFGALRLLTEPLRAPPPLGEPVVAPTQLAFGWIATATAMACSALRRRHPALSS